MRVVIGLGSNVGDRLDHLRGAVRAIGAIDGARIVAASSVYETEPVGGPPQDRFLNAAALVVFDDRWWTRSLVAELLKIEVLLGRVRAERDGPRTIDLDVLWIDGVTSATADAEVPHPRLHTRAFALAPLLEVAPEARDVAGRSYFEWLADVGLSGISRLSDAALGD